MLKAHTVTTVQTEGIPRVAALSSLGETIKRRMREPDVDADLHLEDIQQVKQYIGQVESVLGEMKAWVSRKEQSVSSKASRSTRGGQLSRSQKGRLQPSARCHRPKIFFGNAKPPSDHRSSRADSLNKGLQQNINRKGLQELDDGSKGCLGVYLKHCFVAKIKDSMLPPQRRRNGINHSVSGKTFDRFRGLLPKGILREEQIEFLTPLKQTDLGKSAVDIGGCIEDEDSLVYTASRRRSSLRRIHPIDPQGSINNFD